MNRMLNLRISFAILLVAAPLAARADVFFTDDFSHGSTTNGLSIPGGTPAASYTSYDIASIKKVTSIPALAPGAFTLGLDANTTSGWVESQAIFTTNAVALSAVDDYIEYTVAFTATSNVLAGGTQSYLWLGLYNSGGSLPVSGGQLAVGVNPNTLSTAGSSPFATGNCADWKGYVGQIANSGTVRIYTRPVQPGDVNTTSANQDLVGDAVGSGAFRDPRAVTLATGTTTSIPMPDHTQYTMLLRITLTAVNTLTISNSVYQGLGTGGTILFTQTATGVTGANFLTASFDGMAIGIMNKGTSLQPIMDVSSILITGHASPPPAPIITSQPISVSVATNGSCIFSISSVGVGRTYQWHRNGTNLNEGGNISISSAGDTSTLTISPAGPADVASGANGYYVTITGAGNLSTNSVTNSLSLRPTADLIWTGNGNVWDLNTSANWLSNGVSTTFNYGDNVTFDDSGFNNLAVTLAGTYLSAASITVDTSTPDYSYSFNGSGSFAGPGNLLYKGGGILTLNNVNTYTGGTIISNANAYLVLNNFGGLGTGPLTLAKAGGKLEVSTVGSANLGIQGDVVVADDFTFLFDGTGAFAGVIFGNLSGTVGKTLTLNQASTTTNRYRVYGNNTTMDANIVINGPALSQANYYGTALAPYQSGTQKYNGIISGNGGLVQRGNGMTILAGQNTYAGGTTPTTGAIGFGSDTVGSVTSGPIGTGPLFIAPEAPNTSGSGQVFAYGGARTIANPLQFPSGTNNQTLVIGGTNNLTFSGPVTLNGTDGLGSPTNRTFQVTNIALTTISGVISDGGAGFGLTKTGAGILVLGNVETYGGSTLVSAGTLRVNGQVGGSGVTVATNSTLGGTGIITSPVTVQLGGILAPGASIGTLTINNDLVVTGNLNIEVNSSAGQMSDKAVVSGSLTNAGTGTVIVTNLGPELVVGNTFFLFNKAMSNGAAMTISGGNVAWNNKLAVDGSIAVLGPLVNTTSTNITASLNGSQLTLSWPADHTGWRLQVQTNTVSQGIYTNWVDVPNSGSSNTNIITINPANGSVFYRLVYP